MTGPTPTWSPQGPRPAPRLGGWADGYTTDAAYEDQINVDLCPAWLSMVAVLNGQPPLDRGRPLVWLDLGSGTGLGTCTVAAADPTLEVWGIDYSPAHVDRARSLARDAQLTNCRFVEASFEEAARDLTIGPVEVDVIVVNGVYSWVSPANQRHIVEAVSRRLRPGGLVFVMYESATGWSSMTPLAEALRLAVDADGRPGDLGFPDAARALLDLRANGAHCFPLGPRETEQMAGWADADGRYAAHEYLGAHFAPLLVGDVVDALAGAKCSHLGGIGPLDHHPYYGNPLAHADLLRSAEDPVLRELVRDLILQRALRRDLFRRGCVHTTVPEQRAWLSALTVRGLGKPFEEAPVELTALEVTLEPDFHGPLTEALATADLDVDAVLAIHPGWSFADAVTALGLLVAAGYAAPATPGAPGDAAVAASRRLNEVLRWERRHNRAHNGLVSPATGAMVALDLVELLALDAVWDGAPPQVDALVAHVLDVFAAQGRVVRHEGTLIHDPEAARSVVERRVAALLHRRPALRRLGID